VIKLDLKISEREVSLLNLALMMRNTRRRVDEIMRKNRGKILLLCLFLASILVGIVGAIIYNWIHIEGNARIGVVFSFGNS